MNLRAMERRKSFLPSKKNETLNNITKLSPKSGDILIVRGFNIDKFNEIFQEINKSPNFDQGIVFIHLYNNQTMELLDEEDMNKAGWYRKKSKEKKRLDE